MKHTKALAIAAIAAMAAMTFVGTSAASATQIVICKKLVSGAELCPASEIYPSGTKLLALASNPELKAGGFATVKCQDSTLTAETSVAAAAILPMSITSFEFGVLPTPKLGEGCTTCTGGMHTTVPVSATVAHEAGEFYLRASPKATLLTCFGLGINCTYEGKNIKSLIDHGGSHASAPSGVAYATILNNTTFSRVEPSSGLCPATGTWTANYSVYALESGGEKVQGWLALYKNPETEIVLCKKLLSSGEACSEGEIYPSGTKLLALAENLEFKASPFSAMKCEDSLVEAETTASMGSPLGIKITKLEVGKLPTPKLGEGCTTCTSGVHPLR